jgi:hypothetical protein
MFVLSNPHPIGFPGASYGEISFDIFANKQSYYECLFMSKYGGLVECPCQQFSWRGERYGDDTAILFNITLDKNQVE